MERNIKIILAVLFVLCLFEMPYGFFQFVRFAGFVGFGFLAYRSKQEGLESMMILYVALAILFQPFFKIALGRDLWIAVDVVVATGLLISVYADKNKK